MSHIRWFFSVLEPLLNIDMMVCHGAPAVKGLDLPILSDDVAGQLHSRLHMRLSRETTPSNGGSMTVFAKGQKCVSKWVTC